jgi:hypothetical protein
MSWLREADEAHGAAVAAATEGLSDSGLGERRLSGQLVSELAEAAVTSATPFLRAPLLGAISEALVLHQSRDDVCTTCRTAFPCATVAALTPI